MLLVLLFVCSVQVESKVCGSVIVNNNLTELEMLRNCTVVSGHLKILLLENYLDEKEFEKYSFPELTEINEYLLVYRVNGLRSLGTLFPNLRVIRGQDLFNNFALVLFENGDLTEVRVPRVRLVLGGGETRHLKIQRRRARHTMLFTLGSSLFTNRLVVYDHSYFRRFLIK